MSLTVHFRNVGHGDCAMIELSSGRLMMIDINNSKSLSEDDVAALAATQGVSPWVFKAAGQAEGRRRWEEYYRSLLYRARHLGLLSAVCQLACFTSSQPYV